MSSHVLGAWVLREIAQAQGAEQAAPAGRATGSQPAPGTGRPTDNPRPPAGPSH